MSYDNGYFIWNGGRSKNSIHLKIRVCEPQTMYEKEMLKKEIKYLRIVRKWMKNRYKYYLQFTLVGNAYKKERICSSGRIGIDIGTQSIAIVSMKDVKLLELANKVNDNHAKILQLQREMDSSRRQTNKDNFNADGTSKKGKKLYWNRSNRYKRLAGKVRELQRKNADIRKYQHICLANYILTLGDDVYIEEMNYSALQKRSKKTVKDDKGRYKKKKRFGKSLANKAPAMFISILKMKMELYGGKVNTVDTWKFRASQYDHLSQRYNKKKLSQRTHQLENGDKLQRDLYSAFLLMNADESLCETNNMLCNKTYNRFKEMHDKEITRIMYSPNKKLDSFGIA